VTTISKGWSRRCLIDQIRRLVSQAGYRGEYRFVISRTGTFIYHPNDSFILAESIFSLAEWYNCPRWPNWDTR